MSRSGRVTLPFDQARDFRLGIGEAEELQERCDAGPEEIFNRLKGDRWRIGDVRHTLRLGLIGAGEPAVQASILVERYAGPGQVMRWKDTCRAIILEFLSAGDADEDGPAPGEMKGETTGSPAANSGSAASTD